MPTPSPALLAQLSAIVRATRIRSASAFSFAGHAFTVTPADDETPEAALIRALRDVLYAQTFCQTLRGAYRPFAEEDDIDPALLQTLSRANASQSQLDEGWCVEALQPSGQVVACKGGITRAFWPGEFLLAEGDFGPPQPGSLITVRWPKETTTAQPGFYIAFGETMADAQDELQITRFYLNMRLSGIAQLMALLTRRLNDFQIPFKFKCPLRPRHYIRKDTAVLYICQRHAQSALMALQPVYDAIKKQLRAGAPLFTKPLAAGLAWAQDPATHPDKRESLGQHRSRLLAEGLWKAHQQGRKTLRVRVQCMVQHFAEQGVDLAQPHVMTNDEQTLRFFENFGVSSSTNRDEFLDAAMHIGAQLCREAWWWGDQCNWLTDSYENVNGSWLVLQRSCGPEVYAGSSGIALFLAQLYARTGEPAHRRTAEAALRHALAHLDDVPPNNRASYYTGWLGIACVAQELSRCLAEPAWHEAARDVVVKLQQQTLDQQALDVIGGYASAIPTLLSLQRALPDAPLTELAVRCGDYLLSVARITRRGYAWDTLGGAAPGYELCGYAHGASGIGLALLELGHATHEASFLHAADEAFRYERRWFSRAHNNWADLREAQPDTPKSKMSYRMVAWCHGAVGVGLARLKAYQLTSAPTLLDELQHAAQITLRRLQSPSGVADRNFSQCHGIAGNASFLWLAGRALDRAEYCEAAREAARFGLKRYAQQRLPWPCGVETFLGEVPGYMLGLAGIGAFYLMLA